LTKLSLFAWKITSKVNICCSIKFWRLYKDFGTLFSFGVPLRAPVEIRSAIDTLPTLPTPKSSPAYSL
jgi:hypothetical protein